MDTAKQDRPKTDEQLDDASAAQTNAPAPRQGAKANASQGRARARRSAAAEVAQRLDPQLSGRLTQIILPVVRDFSETIMQAIQPALQSYQEQLARLMVQQVEAILPTIKDELEREAKVRVMQALESMRLKETRPAPIPARAGRGQKPAPQPRQRTKRPGATQPPNEPSAAPAGKRTRQSKATIPSHSEVPGGTKMATETAQSEQATEETTDQNQDDQQNSQPQAQQSDQAQATDQSDGTDQSEGNDSGQQPATRDRSNSPTRRQSQRPTYYYDPQAAARTGLLQLATAWRDAGSTYQAMHAYMEILNRYPQTGTAAAATEGLVELATNLEKQGMFYAALSIYEKLEGAL